jgi:hypothetical protein
MVERFSSMRLLRDDEDDEEKLRAITALAAAACDYNVEQKQESPDVRGQRAWDSEGDMQRSLGRSNDAVPHNVDPENKMSPEDFAISALAHAARGDEDDAVWKLEDMRLDGGDPTPDHRLTAPERESAMHAGEPDTSALNRMELEPEPVRQSSSLPEAPSSADILQTTAEEATRPPESIAPLRRPDVDVSARQYQPTADTAVDGLVAKAEEQGPPEASPWAMIAAALSRDPGRAFASVMQTQAGQAQQWKGEQRQKQQDALQQQYREAQIRKLDQAQAVGLKNDQESRDWQQWKETDASQRDYEQMRLREKAIENSSGGLQLRQDQWDQKTRPDSDLSTTQVHQAGATAGARTQAGIEARHEAAPTITADLAERSGATAAATSAAQEPAKMREKATLSAGDKQHAAENFATKAERDLAIASEIDNIDALIGKYQGQSLPGVGLGQGLVPNAVRGMVADYGGPEQAQKQQDALALNNARSWMAEIALRKDTGAAAPEAESLRNSVRVGSAPNATEQEFLVGLQAARELTQMRIRAYGAANPQAAGEVLEASGLSKWGGGGPSSSERRKAALGRSKAASKWSSLAVGD